MPFRPFRRFRRRRPFRRPPPPETLVRANRLLAEGQTGEAARLFAQSAQDLENRGHLRQAANLHAQAAHVYAEVSDETAALTQARLALKQFKELAMTERMSMFYANITRKLGGLGMSGAVDSLEQEFAGVAAPAGDWPSTRPLESRGNLPGQCPYCGGPLRPDEVEWIDKQRAECGYCGGVVETNEA